MAPVLLDDEQIPRRTLGHDMESFFTVIIWIATLNYADEAAFQAKPLAHLMLDRTTLSDIMHAKGSWFKIPENFRMRILNHFELVYREDMGFLKCLIRLRRILYSPPDLTDDDVLNLYTGRRLHKNDNEETEEPDPMKEGLFRMCMKEMDEYLHETKGCDVMQWIDSQALTRRTPESLMQEGNRVD
jgi:hypothetical protein